MSEMSNGEIEIIQPQIEKSVESGSETNHLRPKETIVAEMDALEARREEFEKCVILLGKRKLKLNLKNNKMFWKKTQENDWQIR